MAGVKGVQPADHNPVKKMGSVAWRTDACNEESQMSRWAWPWLRGKALPDRLRQQRQRASQWACELANSEYFNEYIRHVYEALAAQKYVRRGVTQPARRHEFPFPFEVAKMDFKRGFILQLLALAVLNQLLPSCMAKKNNIPTFNWVVEETSYTRLCSTKKILTVNGQFPGPTLHVNAGETIRVNILNKGNYNVTIHWHGVKQPRNPWSDGPAYITQCPIQPGANFSYEVVLSSEEGTLWWHAHSDWSRATVHGPIIVHPKPGTIYPFPKPHAEFPIVLASWFKGDVMEIIKTALERGGEPNISDAFTINGQPGDLYACSKPGTTRFQIEFGKTYLLRLINSVMNEEMFFAVANHTLTLVGMDGGYIKPFETSYVLITPGQTMDLLLKASQPPSHYYAASRAYASAAYDNTTTTAIFEYTAHNNSSAPSTPFFPSLPNYTDTDAVTAFTAKLRGLPTAARAIDVPKHVDTRLFIAIAVNTLPCANSSCDGPNGSRLAASLNNMSFVEPSIDLLLAYYRGMNGVYKSNFPREPLLKYNYTADQMPDNVVTANPATKVRVLKYNASVEIVFQGTNVLGGENHPMHLHGYSFYVVGSGFGNFDSQTDPDSYNLVDPPELNTVGVPTNGWAAIRFRADNPGVWFMHCHLERHTSWGMDTAFIVTNGKTSSSSIRRPPQYLNPC
uniref:Laccase n=1 Tax=Kalanchoe fedtschenkoi TaxID=63787 RepID=A0A7N0R8F1_KALFE